MCEYSISKANAKRTGADETFRAYNFSSAVKSRLTDTLAADGDYARVWQTSFSGLPENLVGLRLMPFYFPKDVPIRNRVVDVTGVVEALRGITGAVGRRQRSGISHHVLNEEFASKKTICDSEEPSTCSGCMSMSSLMYAFMQAHADSVQPRSSGRRQGSLMSSWRGLAAAAAFYLNSVLRLWNSGQKLSEEMFVRLLRNTMCDIDDGENSTQQAGGARLSCWKLLLAALALSRHLTPSHESWGKETETWLLTKLQSHMQQLQLRSWDEAKSVLLEVCWPKDDDKLDAAASDVWQRAAFIDIN